jgi:hypothetical protein
VATAASSAASGTSLSTGTPSRATDTRS